jgi:hypothetical protein
MRCRHCAADVELVLVDLGSAPPSNAYLAPEALRAPEAWWPLRVLVCERCWLAQTDDFVGADQLFTADYAYFSAYSTGWLAHAERYVADMVARFGLDASSHVVEVAANDGYLLQYVKARGIPCTGIEPTASTAAAARARGIPIVEAFFGVALAEELAGGPPGGLDHEQCPGTRADINDFVALPGAAQGGRCRDVRIPPSQAAGRWLSFDTIYHEHFIPVADRSRTHLRRRPRSSTWRSSRPTAAACASTRSEPTLAATRAHRRSMRCSRPKRRPVFAAPGTTRGSRHGC